ncbi:MAG: hypothetical protein U0K48_05815 [Bacilli bacterium]|nr:hypothetical protein [Bacilli bacterium]
MNKKELELYVKKASENVFKKLAENPEEMLNLIDLQEKYNNLLKEKIELKRQIKKQKEVINNFLDIVDKSKMLLNNPDLLDLYLKIKEVSE